MCGVLTDYTLSSEWRHMKSQVIQKPVVVILGNAGNIGYLAAKVFACQGTVVAMLHEAGEESCLSLIVFRAAATWSCQAA